MLPLLHNDMTYVSDITPGWQQVKFGIILLSYIVDVKILSQRDT